MEVMETMYESHEYVKILLAEREREASRRSLARIARAACACGSWWQRFVRRLVPTASAKAGRAC